MTISPPRDLSAREIRQRLAELQRVCNSDFEDEESTRQRLVAHGIEADEIERQLATFSSNTADHTAVLTSYSLLHSLQHLDTILETSDRARVTAEAGITVLRAAEIAVGCLATLAARQSENLAAGNSGRAVANARWRAGLHELLYRLSGLVVEVTPDAQDGVTLDFRASPTYRQYTEHTTRLHDGLMSDWSEDHADIFAVGLDEPGRYIHFNEFVNVADEQTWVARLAAVRLPGIECREGETAEELYLRVVRPDEIEAMLAALETKIESDLLPFRVVHQISELVANTVHLHLSDVALALLDDEADLGPARRAFEIDMRLMSAVDDSIKLMMRSLTPTAYRDVRPNLGMVQGTSSVALRKVLFNTTYPLLVRAFRLRLCDGCEALAGQDDIVRDRAAEVLGSSEPPHRDLAAIHRYLLLLHQHVRTWRDNHLQLPKTHLGISMHALRPTVSLSGSAGAVSTAHNLRTVHAADRIAPLYEAATGHVPAPVHEMTRPGTFDEYKSRQTAEAVFDVYGVVQERFYRRLQKVHAGTRGDHDS